MGSARQPALAHLDRNRDAAREPKPARPLERLRAGRIGIEARAADTRALARGPGGGLALGDWPVDLVYLRDTDFRLETERTRALREAYLRNEVVVTPSPREHLLLADKKRRCA